MLHFKMKLKPAFAKTYLSLALRKATQIAFLIKMWKFQNIQFTWKLLLLLKSWFYFYHHWQFFFLEALLN